MPHIWGDCACNISPGHVPLNFLLQLIGIRLHTCSCAECNIMYNVSNAGYHTSQPETLCTPKKCDWSEEKVDISLMEIGLHRIANAIEFVRRNTNAANTEHIFPQVCVLYGYNELISSVDDLIIFSPFVLISLHTQMNWTEMGILYAKH